MGAKSATSLNSIGYTTVSIDKATKAKIRALKGDKEIFEFVRELVDNYAESEPQAPLSVGSPGRSDTEVSRLCDRAALLAQYVPMSELRRLALASFIDRCIDTGSLEGAERLYSQVRGEFDKYEATVRAKEAGQSEFEFKMA